MGGTTYDIQASFDSTFPAGSTTSIQYTHPAKPDAPTIGSVTGGDRSLTVSWNPPVDDGGSAITGYHVEWKLRTASGWRRAEKGASARSHTIFGLTNGTLYDVRVRADNARGLGPWDTDSGMPAAPATVPGAPTIGSVTSGDSTLTVTWSPPASDGGSAIIAYRVEWKLNTTPQWTGASGTNLGATARSRQITGLTNGLSYDVRVSAVNSAGNGPGDTDSGTPAAPVTVPGAPTIGSVTSGDSTLTVNWSPPASDGGSAITAYRVEWKLSTATSWPSANKGVSDRSHTISGLTNGSSYNVRVRAVNSAGNGPWDTDSGTPAAPVTVPGAPTGLSVTSGDSTLALSWTASANTGGAPVTSYDVQYKLTSADDSAWTTVTRSGTVPTRFISGLTNGLKYDVRVRAVNSEGGGPWATNSGTPEAATVTVPGAPTGLRVTSGLGSLTVNWNPPVSDGGSAITAYRVEWKLSTATSWPGADKGASDRSHTITGLTNGSEYDVRVRAVNSAGNGPWDTNSGTPTVTVTVPGAPRIDSVTSGDGSLTVNWNPPVSNGGSAITGYRVEWKLTSAASTSVWPGTADKSASDRSHELIGLTNGSEYDVRVRAVNSAGNSLWATDSATPAAPVTVPGAPTIDSVTSGDGTLTLSWSAPADTGGAQITSYDVEYKLTSAADSAWAAVTRSGTMTTQVISGLTNGSEYDVRVRAVNSAGNSLWATDSGTPAAPVTVPGAPTIDSVTSGDSTLTVNWSPPASDGGSAITGYRVEWKLHTTSWTEASGTDLGATARSHQITGLTNGTLYDVRVHAVNSAGNGNWATDLGTRGCCHGHCSRRADDRQRHER